MLFRLRERSHHKETNPDREMNVWPSFSLKKRQQQCGGQEESSGVRGNPELSLGSGKGSLRCIHALSCYASTFVSSREDKVNDLLQQAIDKVASRSARAHQIQCFYVSGHV